MDFGKKVLFVCPRCGDTFETSEGKVTDLKVENFTIRSRKYEAPCPYCLELVSRYESVQY